MPSLALLSAVITVLAQTAAVPQLDLAVENGIRRGVFPGGVVVIGTSERVLFAKGYGHFTWSSLSSVPNPDSTIFDLASLTKVIATTPAVMRLADQGRLDLDAPVQAYLPGFRGLGKEAVTVRHLLEHRSGLRAFLPLDKLAKTANEATMLVLEEPLRWEPGGRVVYSDLNAILLGWIVERVSGQSLDRFAHRELFEPLGMTRTLFRPPRELRRHLPPVGLWRGHPIAGELHDQNAVRLGGVSGHAGLYASAADLARFAQTMLGAGSRIGGPRLFSPDMVREFVRRRPGNRALGWEVNDTTSIDNTGALLSAEAFGHGGYTGTSIWIDPVQDLFIIVLTNRVFAPKARRSISELKRVRSAVSDAAVTLRDEVCMRASSALCE